jgi:hypothetical protein
MIIVNKNAAKEETLNSIQDSYDQIVQQANKGMERFIIYYSSASYSDGCDVKKGVEEKCGNVKCSESGFGSSRNYHGSYDFTVKMEIV